MEERITYFVDVILPLAVPNYYTYRIPFELNDSVSEGQRVIVQLKNKLYSALVRTIHTKPPQKYEAKYIEALLDSEPIVNSRQLSLWEWMSSYYLCTPGEVMNAALPSGLKLSSETKIVLNQVEEVQNENLSDNEFALLEALQMKNILTLPEATEITGKSVYSVIKSLLEKKLIRVEEEIKEKYIPKKEIFIALTEFADDEDNLKRIFDQLERKSPKQLEMLMHFISLSDRYYNKIKYIRRSALVNASGGSTATINQLAKKNIFEIIEQEVGRFLPDKETKGFNQLSDVQQKAYESVKEQFRDKNVVLLHGVTSSGKTEVFIKLMHDAIAQGKQVLYLLPEIALTTQIINRLKNFFGDQVGVYHSKFNEQERVEVWYNLLRNDSKEYFSNPFKIIVGARSSLFLPLSNIGLVIVDEEHDSSYKQYDPAPRYNARDTAIYLASIHSAKVLLGSATPSIESYFNASEGKYGLVEMKKRFGDVQMPEILVADIKEATKRKQMKSIFSPMLLKEIEGAIEQKEQIILFQNRRGFAPVLECDLCAWVPHCVRCDVSLTYHKHSSNLRCHYCGYSIKVPNTCNACGSAKLLMKGFGTEKIEEELAGLMPDLKIARMDLDTTRSKYAYQQIIQDFEERKVDVLVGTQMITKGLDFNNVSVVGILNADGMLNFPDFRAFERSFQLMAQVSGRAGRKAKRGKVIIQAFNPYHSIIVDVIKNDYTNMYQTQLIDRRNFHYPPFYRLIQITLKDKDIDVLNAGAAFTAEELRKVLGKRVLGPEFPSIARIKNFYLKNVLIKIERELNVNSAKKEISAVLHALKQDKAFKSVRIIIDVDPQ